MMTTPCARLSSLARRWAAARLSSLARRGAPRGCPVSLARAPLQRLLQLIEDRRILERRDILRDRLALRDRAQEPPHDLARARLGQIVAEPDVLGLRDRPDLLADPVAQLLRDLLRGGTGRTRLLQ